jgi:cytochrome c oxidase subunit 2
MPEAASRFAGEVDPIFHFIMGLSLLFFALIVGLMFAFIGTYRRRPGHRASQITHNTALELTWSIIPTLLVVVIFWLGFKSFMDMRTAPENAYDIQVYGKRWSWEFGYPRGLMHDELHVPIDTPVRLTLQSDDVIHSLYVPAFRTKMDAVPGRFNKMWFRATKAGEYPLVCAEYCGTNHSQMITRVVVHEPGEFEKWLETADPLAKLTEEQYKAYLADPDKFIRENPDVKRLETPVLMGEKLVKRKGCSQCHTLDGSTSTGPTWKGIWGRTETLRDGSTATVDENYVRESIVDPNKKVVKGYEPVMPKIMIKEREIAMIIEFMKSRKD